MNFGFYYRPDVNRILFHYVPDTGAEACCYDTVVSESRIADYIGIARGQIPQKAYYGRWRTFPDTCDWSWQETKPVGQWRTYFGVNVFEGAYPYAGMLVTPSWSGSMFEALMPDLFVPEDQLGAALVGRQPPGDGARADPPRPERGGLRRLGLLALEHARGRLRGLRRGRDRARPGRRAVQQGPHADRQRLRGLRGPRRPCPNPPPSAYTNGVVTPHAAFLGLRYAPEATLRNLSKLQRDFPGLYTKWGFRDSVNVADARSCRAPTCRSTRG